MIDTDETLESLALIRRRLLDTSKRNRLLNFKESKSRTILIADEDADAIFFALVHGGATPELMPLPEATLFDQPDGEHAAGATNAAAPIVAAPDATTDKNRRLQTPYTAQKLEKLGSRICREARSAIEETGSNMLFLSFGLLEWYEDDNSTLPHLAPLVLVPAQIEKKRLNQETNCYSYAVSYSEEDLETNLSLAEMLRQEFGLILPDFTPELTPELYFCDIERRLLSVKKRWKIRRELLLDLFSFAKLLMYKDLDDQAWPGEAQLSTQKTLVEILAGREDAGGMATFHPEEYRIDSHQRAQELHLVTDADSSQHSAIVDALDRDDNLVIEGPPGTGKSQTITNIIAAALSAGKTVLFVAEKKAALEVVRGRLERANLGDFCLELHSHKTQKGKLHADLRTRIQKTYPDDQSLERAVQEQLSERDKLLRYSQLVTAQPGRDGDRVYEILWAAERWRSACPADLPRPTIKGPLSLSKSEITQRAVLLQDLARLRDELPAAARDRWSCLEPASFLPGDEEAICLALDTFAQRCDALHGALAALRAKGAFEGEVTLELATSLANADLAVLESCPPLSAPAIAQKLAIPKNGTRVRELHAAVERHALLLREAREALGDAAATETSQVMAEKLAELLQMGLGHLSVDDLPELMAGHRRLPEMVSRAEALYKEMEPLLTPPRKALRRWKRQEAYWRSRLISAWAWTRSRTRHMPTKAPPPPSPGRAPSSRRYRRSG